jgi:GH15 family glucan-1,4-alpha-glucosidase
VTAATDADRLDAHGQRAVDTINHNVRPFEGQVIVQPSPTYEGFWARDTMIISLGLIDAGLSGLARDLLQAWATYQIRATDEPGLYLLLNKQRLNWTAAEISSPDEAWLTENHGGLPTSVYVGREEYPDGTREIYSCHPDPDSTAWWLVACARYVRVTGDTRFAESIRTSLQAALDALVRRDSDGDLLVEQCPNEDWADHMRRHGKVTYTQAVWLGAVLSAPVLGLNGPDPEMVRRSIRHALFTRHGRPRDWKCPQAHSDRLAQDSALLVLMEVLNPDESLALLQRLDRLACAHGHRVVTPAFRSSRMGPYHFRRGEYQNAGIWTWLTGWEAQARAKVGAYEAARALIESCFCPTCDRIYEWIDPRTGDRYNADFATGAGSLLSAIAMVDT